MTLDPALPTGALLVASPRPAPLPVVVCGSREPVCVHHERDLDPALGLAYVRALEDARAQLVHALGVPAPLPDVGLGPTPGLDLYLDDRAGLDVRVQPDPAVALDDRRSGFCQARASRAELQRQAVSCVGELVLLGVDAAETPFFRRAIASYLWTLVGAPGQRDRDALDALQANPQLGVAGREAQPWSAGAALFFDYADARLGVGTPGLLPVALVQIARRDTPVERSLRWHNEPDLIDVLRSAFASSRQRFDDFMLDFAVERAFVGARDGAGRHPALGWYGSAGRVRFDWVLTASSLPRRVAPRRPLEPFGSAYSWLELDRVTLGKALAVRAEWEEPTLFRWSLVSVDASGKPIKRFDLPLVRGATSAERSIVDYDGAAGILIVAINLGGVDAAHPFDPDFEPFEPHGFTIYVTEL